MSVLSVATGTWRRRNGRMATEKMLLPGEGCRVGLAVASQPGMKHCWGWGRRSICGASMGFGGTGGSRELRDKIRACCWSVGFVTTDEVGASFCAAAGCNLCRGRGCVSGRPSHEPLHPNVRKSDAGGAPCSSDPRTIPCHAQAVGPNHNSALRASKRPGPAQTAITSSFYSSSSIDAAIYNTRVALLVLFYFYVPAIGGFACQRWLEIPPLPHSQDPFRSAPCRAAHVPPEVGRGPGGMCVRKQRFGLMVAGKVKLGP